jgi:hypothetical protein
MSSKLGIDVGQEQAADLVFSGRIKKCLCCLCDTQKCVVIWKLINKMNVTVL